MCIAVVDFPEPPFSLPSTTTCADADRRIFACTNMPPPIGIIPIQARPMVNGSPASRCFNDESVYRSAAAALLVSAAR